MVGWLGSVIFKEICVLVQNSQTGRNRRKGRKEGGGKEGHSLMMEAESVNQSQCGARLQIRASVHGGGIRRMQ